MKVHLVIYSVATILGAVACGHKASKTQIPKPRITVVEAYQKKLPTRMQFVGQTYSSSDVKIQPRVSGYLLSTHYNQGMPVKKGQLLFKLDPDTILLEVKKAKAELASAKSQLIEAQNNYNRSLPLVRINAISKSTLDQATAVLASSKANLHSAEASLQNANIDLSYTKIYAPMNGVISQTNGSVGDYVGIGTDNPTLGIISNIDSIYTYLSIPTKKYLSIIESNSLNRPMYDNKGLLTDIEMTLANDMIYPYKGKYDFTELAVNSQTGAIVIHVLFPNPDKYLKSGQYVRINANIGGGIERILVPQRAVIQSQGINSIYVMGKDSTVQYRAVTLGDTYGVEWGILDGLEAGELVLTEGLQKVGSGTKIIPITNHNQ